MKKIRANIFIFIMIFLSFQTANSQDFLSQSELEGFLDKAEEQSQTYTRVFKNLSAQEIKTKFYYKTDGSLDEKRVIKSLFIVYESPNSQRSQEYRNVLEFNGENVGRDEKATVKFFAKLVDADSVRGGFNKTRYDGRSVSWGMTLFQDRPFAKSLRPFFDFKLVGTEKIEERDVFVIEYRQTKPTDLIAANPTDEENKRRKDKGGREYSTVISDDLRPTNPLMSGKLWLDAETARIWRNEIRINIRPVNLSEPIVSVEIFNEYQTSDFDIFVPKKFLIKSYKIKGKSEKDLRITKDVESIYEYTKFSKYNTEIEDYEVKND